MTLIKRKNELMPSLASIFDDFFSDDFNLMDKVSTVPSVNIKEHEKEFVIELAVPGMKKDDFQIELDNGILTIMSQKEEEKVEEKKKYTKREFYYNEFKRSFTLPDTVDIEKIDAKYKDGILSLTIRKKPEAQTKPVKKIEIK